jgi:creatinine amidohydrolase
MNQWVLAEQNYAHVKSIPWEAAVLPFGATEPHNYHMPYWTDVYQVNEIGRQACGAAWEKGAKVLLLPSIPFGVNTNHFHIPSGLSISMTPTTLLKILTDVVDSLERFGIKKLVLLNGHGGNELKPLMRELHHKTKVFLCLCDWFRMFPDQIKTLFKEPGEHADEVETSLGLAYFPQFMKMEQAGPGVIKKSRFNAINNGWISITRPWHLATEDTGMGNPAAATAEKGQNLMALLVERLGGFLYDLAKSPVDEKFPY